MPTLSIFYGIVITMYKDDHNPPHFHALYGEYNASFDFDGELIKGIFPKSQTKLVQAWAEIHKSELQINWKLLDEKDTFIKIEPLR